MTHCQEKSCADGKSQGMEKHVSVAQDMCEGSRLTPRFAVGLTK